MSNRQWIDWVHGEKREEKKKEDPKPKYSEKAGKPPVEPSPSPPED